MVIASSVASELAILVAVRGRLWITFWISLVVAGLMGFGFSELISRRVRAMSKAAAAIADGDFDQRLPTGVAPDEIYDLAVSYNQMAEKLGDAFSAVQEREREIAAVVESMAEGVVAFDSAGTVRVINPGAVRLLDPPAGRPDRVCRHASSSATRRCSASIDAGLAGEDASATVCLGELTVLVHCTPLRDEDGDGGRRGAAARRHDRAPTYRRRAAAVRRRREPRDAHADRRAQGDARAAQRRRQGRSQGARRLHAAPCRSRPTGSAGSSPTCSRSRGSRREACSP